MHDLLFLDTNFVTGMQRVETEALHGEATSTLDIIVYFHGCVSDVAE